MAGALTSDREAGRTRRSVDALWRFLRRPSLAIILALLLLGLLLLARFIPQIPGQSAEDPASAMRWLNAERDAWEGWGGILRALGLFHVDGSPLFFALLALLALVCSVHLIAWIGSPRLPRQLGDALHAPAGFEPLPLEWEETIFRERFALPLPPQDAAGSLCEALEANVGPVERFAPEQTGDSTNEGHTELRLLASSGMKRLWLRVLLPAGALLALMVLWFNAIVGWNVRPPLLAPGEQFVSHPHSVAITYTVPSEDAPQLQVAVAGETSVIGEGEVRVGGASVRATTGAPALLLRTLTPLLALPGEAESRTSVGLLFPQVGSEQIVLLPESGAGVRIVRQDAAAESAFLVELYPRDGVQPVQRFEVKDAQSLVLPLETGDVPLVLEPASGLNVTVRSAPGEWLLWPALLLMAGGLVGLRSKPRFALAQLRDWPTGRTAVTLQCNDPAILAGINPTTEPTPHS